MIKVLVELLDGLRYCIKVSTGCHSNGNNGIEWSAVLNELVKRYPNVTPDKHVFEVFDEDFNEFYVISSNGHMIDNLSRIRVSDKRIGNQLSDQSVCVTIDDDNSIAKTRISKNDDNLNNSNNTYTGNSNGLELDTQGMGADLTLTTSITGNTNSVETSVEPQLDTKASATKLIQKVVQNVNQDMANDNTIRSTCSRCSSFSSCDTYRSPESSASLKSDDNFPDTLEMATQLSSGINSTIIPQTKSLAGDSEQNPIDYLGLNINDNYKGNACSRHMPYKSVVVKVGRLWLRGVVFVGVRQLTVTCLIHVLYTYRPKDGKPMEYWRWDLVIKHMSRICFNNTSIDIKFNTKSYLQKLLNNALDLYKKTLTSCPNMETACIVNPLFHLLHVFDPQLIVSDNEYQEIQRLRQLFTDKCINIEPTVGSLVPPARVRTVSTSSSTVSTGGNKTSELSELRSVSAKITTQDLQTFQTLCICIKRTVKELGTYQDNEQQFWPHVSHLMIESGYAMFDTSKCRYKFLDNATKYYKCALKYLPRYSDAIKVYPYFTSIHDMDLSQSLTPTAYDKLKPLLTNKSVNNMITQLPGDLASLHTAQSGPLLSSTRLQRLADRSAQITSSDLKTFQTMCECIERTVRELGSYQDHNKKFWSYVSMFMIGKGYGTYDLLSCQTWFLKEVTVYYKMVLQMVLENVSQHPEVTKMYPFFDTIHAMDLSKMLRSYSYDNLKPLLTNKSVINSIDGHSSATSNTPATVSSLKTELDTINNEELKSLYAMSTLLSQDDLLKFTSLCHCVDRTVRELGSYMDNESKFWPYVSLLMHDEGYELCTDNTYHYWFNDHVTNHYKNALKHLGHYSKAVKVYPFFMAINDMDLSQCLPLESFEKIKQFKDTFKML